MTKETISVEAKELTVEQLENHFQNKYTKAQILEELEAMVKAGVITDSDTLNTDTSTGGVSQEYIDNNGDGQGGVYFYSNLYSGSTQGDGDTAQTPYMLANLLNIPNVGFVYKIDEIDDKKIVLYSAKDDGTYKIEGNYPLLVSISKYDGKLYKPKIKDYINAKDKEIKILNAEDINMPGELTGIKGSPTYVSKAYKPQNNRVCKFIETKDLLNEIKINE